MLSQANKEWISKLGGVSVEDVSRAESDEKEVQLDLKLSGRVITQEDEKLLKEISKNQGIEIGCKEIAQNLEINLEPGEKKTDIIAKKIKDNLSNVFEEKYKNQTPDESFKEMEAQLKESKDKYNKLFETHKAKQDEVKQLEEKFNGLQNNIKQKEINNHILQKLPKGLKFEPEEGLYLSQRYLEIKENEKGYIPIDKETGNIITNGIGEPETVENALKLIAEKRNWYTRKPGMGGENRNGKTTIAGGKTRDEAYKMIKDKGIPVASDEGLKMFKELTTPVA
jgi:myosin heavy subunit